MDADRAIGDWQSERIRFEALSTTDQLAWLSRLLLNVSMRGRATYEAGTGDVLDPPKLRKFNEFLHRIASYQCHTAAGTTATWSPSDAFAMFEAHAAELGIDSRWLLGRVAATR